MRDALAYALLFVLAAFWLVFFILIWCWGSVTLSEDIIAIRVIETVMLGVVTIFGLVGAVSRLRR